MRKLLFALIVTVMGAFAFAGGTPANAMTAGAVTGMSDIVKSGSSIDQVRCWWRYGRRYCSWGHRPRYRWHRRHHNRWWGHRRHYRRY
jgi:hypothetical protein